MTESVFEKIAAGLKDAAAIRRGDADPASYQVHVPSRLDVRAIRTKTGLTQAAFARRFGFPVATLRDWEQGRRGPESSARVLLTVIDKEPEAVQRALGG